MKDKELKWNYSYARKENFMFYPNEEIIRFVAQNYVKRVGIDELDHLVSGRLLKGLDLGCGIGRHVKFLTEMGIDAYGIDLSDIAIDYAKKWLAGIIEDRDRVRVGSVVQLPYDENYFDLVVSHGVLDSMPFEVAKAGMLEVNRCLKGGGKFYFDLISGDDSWHSEEYCGEETVSHQHEEGTIQSYFNYAKIEDLVAGQFEIMEALLIRRESVSSHLYSSRWHVTVQKN